MHLSLPDYFLTDVVVTVGFGLLAIFLIVLGYVVFDKLTPKIDFNEQLNKGNNALAIVVGCFILGLCYVVARVVSSILGS